QQAAALALGITGRPGRIIRGAEETGSAHRGFLNVGSVAENYSTLYIMLLGLDCWHGAEQAGVRAVAQLRMRGGSRVGWARGGSSAGSRGNLSAMAAAFTLWM